MSSVSSTDSYFFQLYPQYFKVEHAFAKNMKPNTTYRLVIYKGIQKADQMAEPIKGKLVGGKILFDDNVLGFYLPVFTPTRNIEFAVKIYESKNGEPEVEIATHRIKSGDYIKSFRGDGSSTFREESQLLDSFVLVFDLFVHNSKLELDRILKEHKAKLKNDSRNNYNARGKTPKKNEAASENLSQSDRSDAGSNRDGSMFASKRKLTRRRGHDGKMKSRHGSRENSEAGSSREGSVRSSQRRINFIHTEPGERFVHSPKKASPPKVEDRPASPATTPAPKVALTATKPQNLVSVGRKDSNASEIAAAKNFNSATPKAKVESNIERSESARRSPNEQRAEPVEAKPTPVKRDTSAYAQRTKPEPVSLRAGNDSTSPPTPNTHTLGLRIEHNEKIFDIKKAHDLPKVSNTAEKPQSQSPAVRAPYSRTPNKPAEVKPVEPAPPQPEPEPACEPQPELPAEIEKPAKKASQKQEPLSNSVARSAKQTPTLRDSQTKRTEEAVRDKPTEERPAAKEGSIQSKSKASKSGVPVIAVKGRPVVEGNREAAEIGVKSSQRSVIEAEGGEEVKQEFDTLKDKLFYVVFVLSSIFLFYNAITPSRKV